MLIEAEHDQMRRAARAEEKSDELNHNSRETATVIPAVRAFDIYGMVAVVPFVAFVLMSLSPKRERASLIGGTTKSRARVLATALTNRKL
jgi:uncharacterized membrane protein YadS